MDLDMYKKKLNSLYVDVLFDDSQAYLFYEHAKEHAKKVSNLLPSLFDITKNPKLIAEVQNKVTLNKAYAFFLLMFTVIFVWFGMAVLSSLDSPNKNVFVLFYFVVLAVSFVMMIVFFMIGRSVFLIDETFAYLQDLSENGWVISTQTNDTLYKDWAGYYDFFNKGDSDDRISLRIYGNYLGYDFCYFEYAYTIERKVTKTETDSDGNEITTTEIVEDYYNESGVFVDSGIDVNFSFEFGKSRKSVKFSHIAFDELFSIYTTDKLQLTKLFSPSCRIELLQTGDLFDDVSEYLNSSNGVLAAFSKEDGFYDESNISLVEFNQLEVVPYIEGRLTNPIKLIKILKGEVS